MARDIIITPKNQEPQIQFTGSGDVSSINLNVGSGISPVSGIREAGSGITTLSFEGTQGQLFSITDNLSSGTLFSVADITGLPLLEVDASGAVKISEYGTSTTVGLIDPKYNFDVFGTGGFQGVVSDKFELYASGDALSDGQEKLMIYDNDGTFEVRASGQGGGSINNFKIVSDRAAISSEENYIAIDGQKTGDNMICRLRLNGSNRFKFYNEGFAPEASNKNLGGNSSTARWKGMYGKFLDLESLNATTSIISATAAAAQSASIAEFKASDDVVVAKVDPDGSIASSGTIKSSGNIISLDKIGINTDTPNDLLEIYNGHIRLRSNYSIKWQGDNNRIRGTSGGSGGGNVTIFAGGNCVGYFGGASAGGTGGLKIGGAAYSETDYKFEVMGSGAVHNLLASGNITVDGNIGVGISNPTDRLTIAGNFGTTHIGYTTNAFRVTHNSNDTYLQLYKRADQSNAAVKIITGGDSYFNAGSVGIRTTSPDATLHAVAANATDIGIISQGASAQTANLQEWQASDDVVIAKVEPDGSIATSGNVGVSGNIIFQDGSYLSTTTSATASELRYYGNYFWIRGGSHGISLNVANSAQGGANISANHSFSWNAGAITSPTTSADTHLIRVDANKVGIKSTFKNSAGDYGELIASGVSLSGVYLANHVPQDTTNMLYNNAGTLTFNGSAVGGGGGGVDAYTSGVAAYSSGVLTTGNPSGIAFFNIDGDLVAGSTTGSGLFYDESSTKLTFKGTNSQIEFRGDDDNLALKIGDSQSNNNEGSHIGFYWQGTSNSYFDTTSAKTRFRIANGDFWFKNNSNADIAKMEGSTTDPLWSLYPQGSSQIGQIIKGQAAHSANLSEWHASDDVVVASVGPDGSISASGDLTIKGDTINFSENSSNFLKVNTNLYFTHGGVNTYLLGNTMFAPLSGKEEHLGYDSDAVHRRWLKVWSHDFDADGTVSCSGGVTASSLTLNTTGTDDVITMTSTDASSTAAPVFSMMRDSASPADGDYLGQIKFKGNSDTGTERIYAKITGKILDASNTSEDGLIEIAVRSGGSNEIVSRIRNDGIRILNDNNLIIEDNGSIGIRTTSPSYGLDVSATGILRQSVILPDYVPATTTNALYNDAGTLKFNGSAVGGGGSSTLSGLSDTNVSSPANGHILIYDNGTSKWDNALMTSTGGTVSFTFGAGTINLEAGVGPSDERLKENVKSIEGSLDKILAMNPVEFEWRDGYEDIHKNSGKDIGFIAQDIEKIQPELVGEHKDFKTLDYEKFSPLIVGAIQELTEQIQEIKKHLNM